MTSAFALVGLPAMAKCIALQRTHLPSKPARLARRLVDRHLKDQRLPAPDHIIIIDLRMNSRAKLIFPRVL